MIKTILLGASIILVMIIALGSVAFFTPAAPQLREPITTIPEPIDERSGLYAGADDSRWLVAPALDNGFYRFNLDSREPAARTASAAIATGSLVRSPEQAYTLRNIALETPEALEAWIFEPAERSGVGIVILHGSGDSDRSNSWYVMLADSLARAGHVVILPDKRGSGRSDGDWRETPLTTLAGDGAAWLTLLRSDQPELNAYGFVGVSQGGTITPEAARLADADFGVALSTSMTDLGEQLRQEVGNDVRAGGAPGFLHGVLTSAFVTRAKQRQPNFWLANADYNPLEHWREWRGPFLIAFGAADEDDNVPVSESVARLDAVPAGARPEWRVYPGVGHALMQEDGVFLPAFEADLLSWLAHFGDSPGPGD
ncbi:MAG: alpha/beta hydrolase family protein [Parasphingopyxis sp.]